MDFTQAANLKNFVLRQFNVVVHIHDTCGGLYFTIDEANESVKEFIISYCEELSIPLTVSKDGRSFFPGVRAEEEKTRVRIAFEPDQMRATAYSGSTAVGACTFSEEAQVWIIEHTFVEPAYRDKGIADRLMETVVTEAKGKGYKINPVCSFAKEWFDKNREYRRMLV